MDRTVKAALVWGVTAVVVVSFLWFMQYQYRLYMFQRAMETITAPIQVAPSSRFAEQESAEPRVDRGERRRQRQREFERAFVETYEEPEGCDRYESERHMVECVNHRMRARQSLRAELFSEDRATLMEAPE